MGPMVKLSVSTVKYIYHVI